MSDIVNKESFDFDWIKDILPAEVENGQLLGDDIGKFVFGGNATFTIVNTSTKKHFTFKVRQPKNNDEIFFVSVLRGSDNDNSYSFIGTYFVKSSSYRHGKKSSIGSDAQSAKVISWFFRHFVSFEEKYPTVQVYHAGTCGRCGRKLTTPESVKSGIGPVCSGRL